MRMETLGLSIGQTVWFIGSEYIRPQPATIIRAKEQNRMNPELVVLQLQRDNFYLVVPFRDIRKRIPKSN